MAIYEYSTQTPIFSSRVFGRATGIRAVVGEQHPIVLGAALAAAMATALAIKGSRARIIAAALPMAGVLATVSNGPIISASGVLIFLLIPSLRLGGKYAWPLVGVGVAVLVYLSVFSFSTYVPGRSVATYDAGYRWALYAMVPHLLAAAPFGYGPTGLPSGQWYIHSDFLGWQDLSITVDSEPVLMTACFGILGLIAYAYTVLISTQAMTKGAIASAALAALAIELNGMSVAIHVWLGFATFTFFLLGICLPLRDRADPKVDGMTARQDDAQSTCALGM